MVEERRLPATGGVELALRVWPAGDREPLVLVHGLASNARLWDGVAERLHTAGHPVAAVDQRGHGRSDKPDQGYDFATVSADLAAVIEGLGFVRPIVAGQSWGGNVVLELAARYPGATRGIVCVDGGTIELRRRFRRWATVSRTMAPPELHGLHKDELEALYRRGHAGWPEAAVAAFLACFEVRDDDTVTPHLSRQHHLAILRELWNHRPSKVYPSVKVPVLLLPADDGRSEWQPDRRAGVELAAQALPRARVHWFVADHDVHVQHPDQVAAVIESAIYEGFFP